MTRGECCGFVKEKEFGVMPRLHHHALATTKIQHADDPACHLIRAFYTPLVIMQAATIAHPLPARRCRYEAAPGVNAVLAGRRIGHNDSVFFTRSIGKYHNSVTVVPMPVKSKAAE